MKNQRPNREGPRRQTQHRSDARGAMASPGTQALTLAMIRQAYEHIRNRVNRTPVMTSETLNTRAGANLWFKCENLQKTGAFKARGATNAVLSLTSQEADKGSCDTLLGEPRRSIGASGEDPRHPSLHRNAFQRTPCASRIPSAGTVGTSFRASQPWSLGSAPLLASSRVPGQPSFILMMICA